MNNEETDRFGLVKKEIISAVPFIGRMLYAQVDVSKEVFRGSTYVGSVRTLEQENGTQQQGEYTQLRLQNGDVVYMVRLTPFIVPEAGTFITKDKYGRAYELKAQLKITHAENFIRVYLGSRDPLRYASEQIKRCYQRSMSYYTHDETERVRISLDRLNVILQADCGISLESYNQVLRPDPMRLKLDEIQLGTKEMKAQLHADDEIQTMRDEIERKREAQKKDFQRREEIKDQFHKLKKSFREEAAKELKILLRERIREVYEYKGSMKEASQEYILLESTFDKALRGDVSDIPLVEENQNVETPSVEADSDIKTDTYNAIWSSPIVDES